MVSSLTSPDLVGVVALARLGVKVRGQPGPGQGQLPGVEREVDVRVVYQGRKRRRGSQWRRERRRRGRRRRGGRRGALQRGFCTLTRSAIKPSLLPCYISGHVPSFSLGSRPFALR